MSVDIPKAEVVFGSVTPPQGDILELRIHLGVTKEVSSFDCLLQNFDKKYTVTNPIGVGDDVSISIGRGVTSPLILTGRVEEVEPESTPVENYMRIKGRCCGERIFRRVVTAIYENKKGEDIVKDLIDVYCGDFGDNFNRGELGDKWTIHSGTWGIENNECYGDAGAATTDYCSAGLQTKKTILKAKFKITEYMWEAGVCVRFQDPDNHYFVSLRSASHSLSGIFLYRRKNAVNTHFANNQTVTILDNTQYEIRVEVEHEGTGVRFKIYLDNTLAINYWNSIEDFESGKIALRVKEGTKCYFDDVSQNGLGHTRDSTELIENTDTTYTLLEYEDTPVFDILKYIAESADKTGVIGFDFRVEYDGKFAFFPRNSKTSPISLSEKIEYSRYSKDIHRVRNKIKVFGAAEKPYPLDTDGQPWSDSLTEQIFQTGSGLTSDAAAGQPDVIVEGASSFSAGEPVLIADDNAQEYNEISSIAGNTLTMVNNLANTYTVAANGIVIKDYLWHADGKWWPVTGNTYLDIEETTVHTGSKSAKLECTAYMYYMGIKFTFNSDKYVNCNKYPKFCFTLQEDNQHSKRVTVSLEDKDGNVCRQNLDIPTYDEWHTYELGVGKQNEESWTMSVFNTGDFNWDNLKIARFDFHQAASPAHGSAYVDRMHFGGRRWSKTIEDSGSQTSYGLRELVEVDEELHSDHECELRGKALKDHLSQPAESITLRTSCLDYGTNRLQPGDKIHVTLPNENVDSDFRIISVEYRVSARDQTLEIMLEVGKDRPLLADYLYGLRSGTVTLERLARTKAGVR